ncbi:hypothetical protein [Algibacter sp. R77976]|uniref:hypothetical protein n=1 Tax=Algibacter sp. R77976 TaxID=3093873 RepID=UPI0037C7F58E
MLHFGKASHNDVDIKENNYMLEAGWKNVLNKDFAYEVFVNRSFSNSTKPFFNNTSELIKYLNANNEGAPYWQKVETYAVGLKGHFFFINSSKSEFSFYVGSGIHFSKSSLQTSKSLSYNVNTGTITDIDQVSQDESLVKSFVMPGLAFRYWVWDKMALGVNAIAFFEIANAEIITQPVQANFYSLAFNVSFKL